MKTVPMKKAVIDQIILWIVLFAIFVSFLFFIIDYSLTMRTKDNADSLADYGARMTALGRTTDEIATGMNNIKISSIATITADDFACEVVATANHQVQFIVMGTYTSPFVNAGENNLQSKTVVFNEVGTNQLTCTLTITFQ